MKATVKAHANIAFIKYWGKNDELLRLPTNDSISMNLSHAHTVTTVDFNKSYTQDDVIMVDGNLTDAEKKKVYRHLDRIRARAKSTLFARVMTKNSFPKGIGSASSASGFAALTVASVAALGLSLSEKECTILARIGSGSACRSIPDGFVYWKAGDTSSDSYAYSLYPHTHMDIVDVLVIVDSQQKKISTTEGMERAQTSPLWNERQSALPQAIRETLAALQEKNFRLLGKTMEADCLSMHAVMESQEPPLHYQTEATMRIRSCVLGMRESGIDVYFTIDAGPNVHVFCESVHTKRVVSTLRDVPGVIECIVNTPARGTHIIADHLF